MVNIGYNDSYSDSCSNITHFKIRNWGDKIIIYKWIQLRLSALLPILPTGHSRYHSRKITCIQKLTFPIDHQCKRDISKLLTRSLKSIMTLSVINL